VVDNDLNNSLKYARKECELRFLLNRLPADLDPDGDFVRIIDEYIRGTSLRLRQIESPDGKPLVYKLGQKYQSPNQETHEKMMTNIYLNEAEHKVFAQLNHSTLTKRRYTYHHDGFDYPLDRFEENLEGLLLEEIESRGTMDITLLPCPEYAVRYVTDDPFFTGSQLAEITPAEFQYWLASY
jgi:CYTH domain-containing protein